MAGDEVGKAIKDARIAAAFAACCVLLVGLLLLIDGQRNKWMAGQIGEVRRIFGEIQAMAGQAVRDAGIEPQAGASVVGGSADHGGGGDGEPGPDLVAAPAAGAGEPDPVDAAEVAVNGSRGRRAGMAGGPRGDG